MPCPSPVPWPHCCIVGRVTTACKSLPTAVPTRTAPQAFARDGAHPPDNQGECNATLSMSVRPQDQQPGRPATDLRGTRSPGPRCPAGMAQGRQQAGERARAPPELPLLPAAACGRRHVWLCAGLPLPVVPPTSPAADLAGSMNPTAHDPQHGSSLHHSGDPPSFAAPALSSAHCPSPLAAPRAPHFNSFIVLMQDAALVDNEDEEAVRQYEQRRGTKHGILKVGPPAPGPCSCQAGTVGSWCSWPLIEDAASWQRRARPPCSCIPALTN